MEVTEQKPIDLWKPKGLCQKCHKHKATDTFTNSTMDLIHGMYEYWCRCCVLKEQLAHAQAMIKAIPQIKKDLRNITGDCTQQKARKK